MSSYWLFNYKILKCRPLLFTLVLISLSTLINIGVNGDEFFVEAEPFTFPKTKNPAARSLMSVAGPVEKPVVSEWEGFESCNKTFCLTVCSGPKPTEGVCDPASSNKVCKCGREKFSHSFLKAQGILRATAASNSSDDPADRVCHNYCEKNSAYGRTWWRNSTETKHCICLTGQITPFGYTMCDRHNHQKCQEICHNTDIRCAFNGACICRDTWSGFFNLTEANSRAERVDEKGECETKCHEYNYDWVGRVYDLDAQQSFSVNKVAPFGRKYCLCGEEVVARNVTIANKLRDEGFQVCTGLKCKQRCQSVAAHCEPDNRRACYCNSQNIFIKKHLWSRLPSHTETMCQSACSIVGLDARVIEWNPFFLATSRRFEPYYRKSAFQYLYDGKFCHCIKIEIKMNQFRPCSDEICEFFCGHNEATCDMKTRRACLCNTHKLMLNTGRIPEPIERTCDITCRSNRMTGFILDVTWKKGIAEWGGTQNSVNKYCLCVRPVSAAGLSHCEPENDMCPHMCQKPEAYCTREKDCRCGDGSLKDHKNVRRGNYKEWDECSESCRSWMWPLAEDLDNRAWIYDYALDAIDDHVTLNEAKHENGNGEFNTTEDEDLEDPSFPMTILPGDVALQTEALSSWTAPKKYCLCAKSVSAYHVPGYRGQAYMEPMRVSKKMPCINNHTCTIVNSGLEIIY